MKIFKKITLVTVLSMPVLAQASGIPVVDGAAAAQRQVSMLQTVQQWAKEAKQWTETVSHYKSELKAYADQLASQTGIRDVQAFIGEAHSLYNEINSLKSEFTPVINLVSGGKNALSANAKSLFEKYNLFDRCKNLRQGEITSCEANIVSTVESISFLDSFESNINSKLKTIDKLSKRMAKSQDVKESQDLKNVMDVQLAALQSQKIQLDLFNARQTEFRRLMNEQQKQLASQRRLNVRGVTFN
ncbi:transport associated protein 4 [Rodentibacter pneumotropicus]|uniref:Transport associated protein 4 n=1 Tax=Rodentibacter pneumotropicus TaxID=758 RepID=A0A4S2PBL5_9PAST|nr:type IV secretion system protein [Rodentibacter pneumotropicus]THA00578.1 transport associated protein 4 [Rodentibacter pneumotropicus]THA11246.1 transport associated protein 4 [Rodentibacter pneumotropicus]